MSPFKRLKVPHGAVLLSDSSEEYEKDEEGQTQNIQNLLFLPSAQEEPVPQPGIAALQAGG